MNLFWTLVVIATIFVVYLFPSLVASARDRPNRDAITVVNLFFGWTVVGWILCLVWAMTSTSSQLAQAAAQGSPGTMPPQAALEPPMTWRAPVSQTDSEDAQGVMRSLVEGDKVRLVDMRDRIVVRFNENDIGLLDKHDEKFARAHVAKSRQVFARVAAVTDTTPKRLILTVTAS